MEQRKLFFKKIRLGLVCFCLLVFASGRLLAANPPDRITIKVTNAKLVDVLEEVKKQSGYDFIYNEKFVKNVGGITMNVKMVSLDSVMHVALKNTNLTYKIQNKIIVLTEKAKENGQKYWEIRGSVRDNQGLPMPGVTILIKGTTIGVASDVKGNFIIRVPQGENQMLSFSFIGMESKVVPVTGKELTLNVILKPTVDELDEVVITGYGQTTKRMATGSVAVLTKDVFENQVHPTVDLLLQGQVAGVNVTSTSGRPGSSAKIRIRGTNTISGNAEPLWVVDGVPLQRNIPNISTGQIKAGDFNDIFNNGIAGINPNDIENVTILKDASAAAIYGSRAAGGVIVVTTKRGKVGQLSVNYSANGSIVMKPQRDADLMNSGEKLAWEQELWDEFSASGYQNGTYYPVVGIVGMLRANKLGKDGKLWTDDGFTPMTSGEQDAYLKDLSKTTTDWFDQIFRNAFSMNHYLSLSGGSEKATYYLSAGYSLDNGILKKTSYDRYNVTGRMDLKPSEKFRLDFGFDLAQQKSKGSSLNVDPFKYAYFANPYEKPYNADGSYRPDFTYFILNQINGGTERILPPNGYNIMREMDETSSDAENLAINLRMTMNYNLSSKFRLTGVFSYSFTNNKTDNINGIDTYAAFMDRAPFEEWNSRRTYGSITQTSANNNSYSARGQIDYSDTFWENHRVSVTAGTEIRGEKAKSIFAKRYGYDPVTGNSSMPLPVRNPNSDQVDYNKLVQFATFVDQLSGQSIDETRFASFYASLDYSLYNKYIASVTFRTDGSNNFGSDEQFNPAWSVSAAWHIGDEAFMEQLRPVLSRLKLSVAMGYTGNVNKTVKPDLVMSYSSLYRKLDDMSYRMGYIKNAPNPHLRWEKTKDMKVALDFGLFDNRIGVLVEAYYRLSTDVVSGVEVPYTTGFVDQGFNTSRIENKGIEGTIQALVVKTNDFKFNLSANMAWNWNSLKRYVAPRMYGEHFVGYPLGALFSGKPIGINPETGLYKYKLRPDADILRASDLKEPDNYMFYRGTSSAPLTGGFTFNFAYKSFALSVGGNYSIGGKIENKITSPANKDAARTNASNKNGETIPTSQNDLYVNHLNVRKDVTNRWTPERRTGVKYPRIIDAYGERLFYDLIYPTASSITRASMLENVSYLRVKTISLSYSFPEKMVSQMKLNSLGVSCSLTNLFTITDYSGIDPEIPGATYPTSRTVTFGVNIGF